MAKKAKSAKIAGDALSQLRTSPYTSPPVTLYLGPTHRTYYLPEVLLQRLENIPSRDPWTHEIHLVDVDASIGHVLIHFLHTGVYQTLNDEAVEDADITHKSLVRNEFQTALLALEAARKYSVPGLQELAKIELERRGNEMSLRDAVRAIREEFVAGPSDEHAWLRDFVSRKVRWTFEQDQPMFSAPDFFENIESPTLTQLLAQVIVRLYSEEVEKLRKGKAATNKMPTPEHSEPLGIYLPHLPRLPPKGIAATSIACLASVEKFEAFDDSAAAWDPCNLDQGPGDRPKASAPAALSSCNTEEKMQLKVKPEEEQFQCEGVGRLEQERIVAEEAACAAEEEQACIEAEKVKVAQIATEEKESCCIAKKESKASPGWGMLGSGKKKESTKQRHEREAKEKKEREEQERLKPTTVIAEVAAVAVIIPAVREDSKVEVYPYAGLSESLAKKPKARLDQKAKLKEEEEATEARLREEEEAERRFPQEKAAAAEVETNRKKEDNIWVKWGALSVAKTKKKGKKTELIHLEEEERLGKEVEEEAERRKKVEEEAAAAAKPMILNSTSGLSWEKLVLDTDDWAAFGASTPSKKKKGKKGKTVEPVPPPPPDCPAESPTTFDDINQEEAVTTEIDMVLRDTGATKSGFRLSGLRNCTSGWGPSDKDTNAEGDNSWGSSDKTKKDDGFDFDFDTFKSPPAEKKPAGDDGWGGLRATTKTKKKSTKGVLIDDSVLKVPPPPPEPDKKEEDDSWGTFSFGGTAKGKKKKKKGVLGEEPPPPEPEPEPEPEAAVNELEPAKEENPWGCGWGAADAGTKKKKKGKKGELESNPEPVPEPKPEFKPPKMEVDSYSGLIKPQPKKLNATSDREAKLKKEEDTKRQKEVEEAVQVRRQEKEEAEQIRLEEEEVKVRKLEEEEAVVAVAAQTGVSSFDPAIETGAISKDDGCELRPEHLSRDDGWQNCKSCELYMRKTAFKLYREGPPNVSGFSTTNMLG